MENPRIQAYFTGHYHPTSPSIIHHLQGAVEYLAPGAFQFRGFGLITIDNNRFVYNHIILENPPVRYFITNPIPIDQLSSHQTFSETETELRVISYEGNPNIKLNICIHELFKMVQIYLFSL